MNPEETRGQAIAKLMREEIQAALDADPPDLPRAHEMLGMLERVQREAAIPVSIDGMDADFEVAPRIPGLTRAVRGALRRDAPPPNRQDQIMDAISQVGKDYIEYWRESKKPEPETRALDLMKLADRFNEYEDVEDDEKHEDQECSVAWKCRQMAVKLMEDAYHASLHSDVLGRHPDGTTGDERDRADGGEVDGRGDDRSGEDPEAILHP